MELIAHLYDTTKVLVVMVLHDLNHAALQPPADRRQKGRIVVDGPVEDVFCRDIIEPLYQIQAVMTEVQDGTERIDCVCPMRRSDCWKELRK